MRRGGAGHARAGAARYRGGRWAWWSRSARSRRRDGAARRHRGARRRARSRRRAARARRTGWPTTTSARSAKHSRPRCPGRCASTPSASSRCATASRPARRCRRLQRRIVEALRDGECSAAALARRVAGGVERVAPPAAARRCTRRRAAAPRGGADAAAARSTKRPRASATTTSVSPDAPRCAPLYGYLRDHPLRRAPAHELRHSFANATTKLRALIDGWPGARARGGNVPHRAAAGRGRRSRRDADRGAAGGGRCRRRLRWARASCPGCSGV